MKRWCQVARKSSLPEEVTRFKPCKCARIRNDGGIYRVYKYSAVKLASGEWSSDYGYLIMTASDCYLVKHILHILLCSLPESYLWPAETGNSGKDPDTFLNILHGNILITNADVQLPAVPSTS